MKDRARHVRIGADIRLCTGNTVSFRAMDLYWVDRSLTTCDRCLLLVALADANGIMDQVRSGSAAPPIMSARLNRGVEKFFELLDGLLKEHK